MLMPALLTRMSTRPNRSWTSPTTRSHSGREEMSAGTAMDAAAYCRHFSTTSSRRSLRRATAATVAPRRARSVATVAPMPDDAPVTTATWPAISMPASRPRGGRASEQRREGVHARGRRLFRAARTEENALADDANAGVARRRQRDRVDQQAGRRVPDLDAAQDPGADERHPAR